MLDVTRARRKYDLADKAPAQIGELQRVLGIRPSAKHRQTASLALVHTEPGSWPFCPL